MSSAAFPPKTSRNICSKSPKPTSFLSRTKRPTFSPSARKAGSAMRSRCSTNAAAPPGTPRSRPRSSTTCSVSREKRKSSRSPHTSCAAKMRKRSVPSTPFCKTAKNRQPSSRICFPISATSSWPKSTKTRRSSPSTATGNRRFCRKLPRSRRPTSMRFLKASPPRFRRRSKAARRA